MSVRRSFLNPILVALAINFCTYAPALGGVNIQDEAPRSVRKSEEALRSSALTRVDPVYPPLAASARVFGSVIVEVTVDERGEVVEARATIGHPLLKDAAITAARGWRFSPAQLSGAPAKVIGLLTFNFSLDDVTPPTIAGFTAREKSAADSDEQDDIEEAKKAINANSLSPEAHLDLAQAYADAKMFEKSLEPYWRAIELKPAYRDAYIGLAAALHNLGRHQEEPVVLKQATERSPNDVDLLESIGKFLGHAEHYNEALEFLNQLAVHKPQDAVLRNQIGFYNNELKRYDEAAEAYQEAVRIRPDYALAYHNLGWAYYKLMRYQDSLAAYEKVIAIDPRYPELDKIYRNIGLAYIRLVRYEDAAAAYKRAIAAKPGSAYGYTGLADTYYFMERYDQALEQYKKGLEIGVDDYMVHGNLGSLYLELGRPAEAEKAFRDAIHYKPDYAEGYVYLAESLCEQQKMTEAEGALRDVSRIEPKNADLHFMLAAFLDHRRNTKEAEAEYRLVLQLKPDHPQTLNNLGYLLVERNENLSEALRMIQRAVASDPRNGWFLDSLGWAYFKLGKLEEAERYLEEAARIITASAANQEHLGDLYQRRNKPKEARGAWQKALALSSESEQTARLTSKLAGDAK